MSGDTWRAMCHNAWKRHAMCHTHGLSCVNMHVTFEAYIYGVPIQFVEQQGEGGGREKRKGGKEKRKGGKENKREQEKRRRKRRKRGKRKRKRKECRAVSRPRQQRTRNCATRGRFPPTLVILRLGAA